MCALKINELITQAGPNDGGGYSEYQSMVVFAAPEMFAYAAPVVSPWNAAGASADSTLFPSELIKTISGVWVVTIADFPAAALTSFELQIRRDGAVVSGSQFAGWASGENPDIPAFTPTLLPWLPAATSLVPVPGQGPVTETTALQKLEPNDIVTLVMSDNTQLGAALCFLLFDVQ